MRCPCSRSCHSCANAVAELSLQPSPPSRSPCRHVAVALLWSRCHCALAGDRHAYPPSAVPRCLVGSVALGFVPCWRSRQSCRCCRGGWSPRVRALRRTCQLPGHPRLCAPLGVVVGIIVGAVVGVLIAGWGAMSSSLASSIINANAASSTPVRQAAFVARRHTSALWCLPHPHAFAAEAAASLLVAAAIAASGRRAALTLALTVRWAAIVPHRRRRRRRSPVALPS